MSLDSTNALQSIDRMTICMNRILALTLMVDLGDNMELDIQMAPNGVVDELNEVIAKYREIQNEMETHVIEPITEIVQGWNVASN